LTAFYIAGGFQRRGHDEKPAFLVRLRKINLSRFKPRDGKGGPICSLCGKAATDGGGEAAPEKQPGSADHQREDEAGPLQEV
jgi:hypothetical protein